MREAGAEAVLQPLGGWSGVIRISICRTHICCRVQSRPLGLKLGGYMVLSSLNRQPMRAKDDKSIINKSYFIVAKLGFKEYHQ
jgi:hypothetical protein